MSERRDGDAGVRSEVQKGLADAKRQAQLLDLGDVKNGNWFVRLLQQVVDSYDRNARAAFFQQKYPGLPPDEVADKLISVVARYAAVAGGIAGVAATGAEIGTLGTAGMTAPLLVGTVGAEMLYLAGIQLRLVLDLAVVYDVGIDADDPEDVLLVFGYALGVTPTGAASKLAQKAAGTASQRAVRKYVSKGVLQSVQSMGAKIGVKILQKTIIKYTVPVASTVAGSSVNYLTTKSVGKIAKASFAQRGEANEQLRSIISRSAKYDLVFPAAALYMANADGTLADDERELYQSMLARMSLPEHDREEFEHLAASEEDIIHAAAGLAELSERRALLDALSLLAVCDGEFAESERAFLTRVAEALDVPVNLDEVERDTQDYRDAVARNLTNEVAASVKRTTDKVRGGLGKLLLRGLPDAQVSEGRDE